MGSLWDYNLQEARRRPLLRRAGTAAIMILTAFGSPLLVVALFCVLIVAALSLVLCGAGPEGEPDEGQDARQDTYTALQEVAAARQEIDALKGELDP